MTKRFTSGAVGKFSFSDLNAISDQAGRGDRRQPIDRRFVGPRLDPFFAKIGEPLEGDFFEDGPNQTPRKVFEWSMVMVESREANRKIVDKPRAPKSSRMGPPPKGRAVCLGGEPTPGDLVLMYPLIASKAERWFGFTAKMVALGATTILKINDAEEMIESKRYKYSVAPRRFNQFGSLVANPGHPPGFGFNAYEVEDDDTDWGHGQSLFFPGNPPRELEPDGPIQGYVLGTLCQAPKIEGEVVIPAVWGFEATVPLIPRCDAGAAFAPAHAIETLLRDGIA